MDVKALCGTLSDDEKRLLKAEVGTWDFDSGTPEGTVKEEVDVGKIKKAVDILREIRAEEATPEAKSEIPEVRTEPNPAADRVRKSVSAEPPVVEVKAEEESLEKVEVVIPTKFAAALGDEFDRITKSVNLQGDRLVRLAAGIVALAEELPDMIEKRVSAGMDEIRKSMKLPAAEPRATHLEVVPDSKKPEASGDVVSIVGRIQKSMREASQKGDTAKARVLASLADDILLGSVVPSEVDLANL